MARKSKKNKDPKNLTLEEFNQFASIFSTYTAKDRKEGNIATCVECEEDYNNGLSKYTTDKCACCYREIKYGKVPGAPQISRINTLQTSGTGNKQVYTGHSESDESPGWENAVRAREDNS